MPAPSVGFTDIDLPGLGQPDLVATVHVEVEHARRPGSPERGVGEVLGGDQVLVRRQPHVADVDPAEQAVPVAVVRLAAVEVVDGPRPASRPSASRRPSPRLRSICLWRSLTSRYLTWKLRQNPPRSQRAAGIVAGDRVVEEAAEHDGLVGRQRPLAHLGVRRGRDVDAADGRLAVEPLRRGHGRQPGRVRLERLEEPLHPATAAPAVLVGRGPGAELLAVVAHHPDPVAVLRRVVAQVLDDRLHRPERDPVAEALLGPEDREQSSPGPRSCTRPRGSPRGSPPRGSAGRRGSSSGSRPWPAPSAGRAPRRARPATRRAAGGR